MGRLKDEAGMVDADRQFPSARRHCPALPRPAGDRLRGLVWAEDAARESTAR